MNFLKNRPRLSLDHFERVEKEVAKTEVTLFAYGILLGGLLIAQHLFAPEIDVEIKDKS